ncbi:autotransporter outer membrane beta-barrel domain-containing protein [Yersinia enterocolitica]|uniref:autotransporter family protein n=1 Tax=Yersinia enterocolitica TaxID=630 RepID=UPI000506C56B|nr:autotransporter outer membrane beta-barrel domain-containing protein [Yersinia enterocolitica]KGA56087.1 outer membrane autotransporter barrel domain protein [Yersinia enterocolitica]CQH96344.1 type V secretory pathway%2C adhesin AidA [Yersinia enterocolitica]
MNTPSISQPNSRKETQQAIEPFLLHHYIIPYTKSISVLLLVLSSSAISAQRLGQEQKPETVNHISISTLSKYMAEAIASSERGVEQEQKPETVNYTSISTLSGHMVKAIVNLPEYINNMPKYYREAQEYSIETQKYNQIQIKEITSNKYFSTARSLADISTSSTTSLGTTLLKPLTKELKSIVSTTLAKPILRRPDIEDNRLVDLLLELQYAKKMHRNIDRGQRNEEKIQEIRKSILTLERQKEQWEKGEDPQSWNQKLTEANALITEPDPQWKKEIMRAISEGNMLMQVLDEQEKTSARKIIKSLGDSLPSVFAAISETYPAIESGMNTALITTPTKPEAKVKSQTKEKVPVSPQKTAPKPIPKPAPIIAHNPQVGSYIANQIAAQQMFISDDLQYRQGETRYIDPVTGEEKVTSLWLNTSGAKNRFNSGNDQLRTKSNRYAIQLGGTVSKWSNGGDDQGILGITAGFGKSTNHSHSTSSHHQAQGSVDGYNLGLYSIWYADNQTRLGPYIDLLTQYGWFNNQVKAPNVTTAANYKSYLFTSALETGYKIQLLETTDTKLSIQPRAKVMWQRTSGLLHKEPNAILINVEENNAVTTKLGMRTVLEFNIDTLSSAKNLQISPSFEAHWVHSRVNQGVQLSRAYTNPRPIQDKIELVSVNVSPQGNNNIADLKLGIEANIDSNLRLWTYLGHQFGGHNYSDTQATVGMNYRF